MDTTGSISKIARELEKCIDYNELICDSDGKVHPIQGIIRKENVDKIVKAVHRMVLDSYEKGVEDGPKRI